ncbi:uncharacterized protein LOC116162278 [Photinus pyralis]|uniref:uncharacterized protein LOC116162278 n=1 Tax=Photinus pyralis TaxID=7054 RepID=UPI00126775F7|nr:uncharacterized protein LOC116162278 [Photinus pyralis]
MATKRQDFLLIDMYTRNDVNKRLLARETVVHNEKEYLGQLNGYRDDEYRLYKEKRCQFLNAANLYKECNKTAIYANKIKLDEHTNDILRYDRKEDREDSSRERSSSGSLLRKRSYRHIHESNFNGVVVCQLEPWFVRYLKLCKFIYAARTIIVYNRLLRNLRILKTWDESSVEALEKQPTRRYDNVSYPHVFEKFL